MLTVDFKYILIMAIRSLSCWLTLYIKWFLERAAFIFIIKFDFTQPKFPIQFIKDHRFMVHLHLAETKSHPGMKKSLFTCEFHAGMKQVEFHAGMKLNLKENLPLSMKT